MATLLRGSAMVFAVIAILMGAACAPATAPSQTPAPSKAAASSSPAAKPSDSAGNASKPAASSAASPSASAAAKPGVPADWKAQWDKLVAAAKQEGKLVVAGGPGDTYRNAALSFQKTYPEIQVEYTGISAGDLATKMAAERQAGKYLWDVAAGGTTPMITTMKPQGMLDPLRPALLLPEILDDSKWMGGFEDPWIDKDRQHIMAFQAQLAYLAYVNRDLVPESELSTIDQLLDPKWKGKIVTGDPRATGTASAYYTQALIVKGEDWLRKLLAQDLVIMKDDRSTAEAVVRGRNPIAIGVSVGQLEAFRQAGAIPSLLPLEPNSTAGAFPTTGYGALVLINKPPHPNAAKLYANWMLSIEGQNAYVKATDLNSRRLDVEGPPANRPKAGVKYLDTAKEEYAPQKARASAVAKEVIK